MLDGHVMSVRMVSSGRTEKRIRIHRHGSSRPSGSVLRMAADVAAAGDDFTLGRSAIGPHSVLAGQVIGCCCVHVTHGRSRSGRRVALELMASSERGQRRRRRLLVQRGWCRVAVVVQRVRGLLLPSAAIGHCCSGETVTND